MNPSENVRIAIGSLGANKLRASLTMLGIMIGVAAVITLLAIGDSVSRFVANQFLGLGSNLMFVIPQQDQLGPPGSDPLVESTLTLRDAELLADPAVVPDAAGVSPLLLRNVTVAYEGTAHELTLRATTSNYDVLFNLDVARGQFISEADVNGRARAIVLGPDTVEILFPPDIDPLGSDVRVNGLPFRVVGVLVAKGGSSFGGSQDDTAVVPITTAQDRLFNLRSSKTGEPIIDSILVQGVDEDVIDDMIIDITNALRLSHDINFRDADDFQILTQQDFLQAFGAVTNVLTLFLGAIASISLLVGGIGIMNIMLVSVTERTREIGLRKAVGAKSRDILGQFLTEAVLLAMFGGLLGVALGAVGAAIVRYFVPDLNTSITLDSVLLSVGFSAAVGLFFGIYPASRAASLNPIDALRFE